MYCTNLQTEWRRNPGVVIDSASHNLRHSITIVYIIVYSIEFLPYNES